MAFLNHTPRSLTNALKQGQQVLHKTRESNMALLEETRKQAGKTWNEALDQAEEAWRKTKSQAESSWEEAKETAAQAWKEAKDQPERSPWLLAAIAVSVLAGVAVYAFLRSGEDAPRLD